MSTSGRHISCDSRHSDATGACSSSSASISTLDLAAWDRLKFDLLNCARDWLRRGYGKSDKTFYLSDEWVGRALALEGIDHGCLDYLAIYAQAGKIELNKALHFVKLQDHIITARSDQQKVESLLEASPMVKLLAARAPSRNS